MLSLVHLIYMAGDKCMRQNACFYCVNTSSLVDRCICLALCQSRQILENVLSLAKHYKKTPELGSGWDW